MATGSSLESGTEPKKKDSPSALHDDHDKDKKDEADKKDGPDKQQDASKEGEATTVAGKFFGELYKSSMDVINTAYDFFKGSPDHPDLSKMTITNDKGQQVDGKGNVIAERVSSTSAGTPGDAASSIALKSVDSSAVDKWNYDTWFNIVSDQQKANPTEAPKEAPKEPTTAEKVASWVAEKWDAVSDRWEGWFGGKKAGQYESTDAQGRKSTTTISDKGVDHVTEGGSRAHSDGRGTVEVDKDGTTGYYDKSTGRVGERYKNGADMHRNSDGSFDVTTPEGDKVHVKPDGTVVGTLNGHQVEINKERVTRWADRLAIQQHRRGDGRTGAQEAEASQAHDGQPSATLVEDKGDGTQMVVLNDGKGNTVKLRHNGERIMASADNPGVELVTNGKDDNVRLRVEGNEYHLKKQKGEDGEDRWYVYDNKDGTGNPRGWINGDGEIYSYDANDPTKTGQRIGRVQGLTNNGDIQTGAGTIGSQGEVALQGELAKVRVGPNNTVSVETNDGGKTVISTDAKGTTSTVSQCTAEGVCDATQVNTETGAATTRNKVEVNANGEPVVDSQGQIQSGQVAFENTTGPDGKEQVRIGVGDTNGDGQPDFANLTVGPDGISAVGPNGTTWDSYGNMHRESSGTTFGPDGSVHFADGTEVDADGNVYYKGEKVGSAGGYDNATSEGAAVARVNAILSIAASISASASVDPGKIGQLMALYAELGNAQGIALQSGDMGAFMSADLAKATLAGAISEQQAAAARQEMAKYFSDHPLSTDQLAQLQNSMRGNSSEEVHKFMVNAGWTSDKVPN